MTLALLNSNQTGHLPRSYVRLSRWGLFFLFFLFIELPIQAETHLWKNQSEKPFFSDERLISDNSHIYLISSSSTGDFLSCHNSKGLKLWEITLGPKILGWRMTSKKLLILSTDNLTHQLRLTSINKALGLGELASYLLNHKQTTAARLVFTPFDN